MERSAVELAGVTLMIVGADMGELVLEFDSVDIAGSGLAFGSVTVAFGSVMVFMIFLYHMWKRKKGFERIGSSDTI